MKRGWMDIHRMTSPILALLVPINTFISQQVYSPLKVCFFSSSSPFVFLILILIFFCLPRINSMARSCIYFVVARAGKLRQGSKLLPCLQGMSWLRFDLTYCCLALLDR